MTYKCIECGSDISTGSELIVAEIIKCPHCEIELEVISVEPIQLILAPEVEEDWGE